MVVTVILTSMLQFFQGFIPLIALIRQRKEAARKGQGALLARLREILVSLARFT